MRLKMDKTTKIMFGLVFLGIAMIILAFYFNRDSSSASSNIGGVKVDKVYAMAALNPSATGQWNIVVKNTGSFSWDQAKVYVSLGVVGATDTDVNCLSSTHCTSPYTFNTIGSIKMDTNGGVINDPVNREDISTTWGFQYSLDGNTYYSCGSGQSSYTSKICVIDLLSTGQNMSNGESKTVNIRMTAPALGTSCTNDCTPSGTTRCLDSSTQQSCGNYDADSCLEWGGNTPCQYGCSGITCAAAPVCTDECTTRSATRCLDSATRQTCGNYDADSCLEWGDSFTCTYGCSGTACASAPPPSTTYYSENANSYADADMLSYFNYTKPAGATGAIWSIKYGTPQYPNGVIVNFTVPTTCFNSDSSKLMLRWNNYNQGWLECYAGASGWISWMSLGGNNPGGTNWGSAWSEVIDGNWNTPTAPGGACKHLAGFWMEWCSGTYVGWYEEGVYWTGIPAASVLSNTPLLSSIGETHDLIVTSTAYKSNWYSIGGISDPLVIGGISGTVVMDYIGMVGMSLIGLGFLIWAFI